MGTKKNPLSLYGNSKAILNEAIRTNEILAEMAGENYEPKKLPLSSYDTERRTLAEAKKKNELLQKIADGGGGGDVKNIAPAYDSTSTYSVGDYVIYDDYLYTAVEDIDAPEDFDPEKWEKVKLGEEVAKKANSDGYYEQMGVGTSDRLATSLGVTDGSPYVFRTSGGSLEIGDRAEIKKLVGGTVVWNQLIGPNTMAETMTDAGVTYTNNGDGSLTISGTKSTELNSYYDLTGLMPSGFVYLVLGANTANAGNGGSSGGYNIFFRYDGGDVSFSKQYGANPVIIKPNVSSADKWKLQIQVGYGSATPELNETIYPICINLTQMFGDTTADSFLDLGTSAAWAIIKSLFPSIDGGHIPYDIGTLRSVRTSGKRNVGFNLYDHSAGTAKLVGGKQYQITGTYTALSYSTGQTIAPDGNGKFTPAYDGILTVTGGNSTTTCVHLVWDGERDGEWEAYSEHTYAFDGSLELRGMPVLDGNGSLVYDGDEYAPDGTVTRKYGIVDLGTLIWAAVTSGVDGYPCFYNSTDIPNIKAGYRYMICAKYPFLYTWRKFIRDKTITMYNNATSTRLAIRDTDYTSPSAFKTSLSGVYLIYELETPTTETADPYSAVEVIDNFGTEEFLPVTGVSAPMIPVGHETLYRQDLKAKLEAAPNNPSEDGVYLMKRENGVNNYVPFADSIPETPSDNGTYVLTATVSGETTKTTTLSWEAAT